jgi:hypothetical protein
MVPLLDDNAARFGVRNYAVIRKHAAAGGRYHDMGVREMGMYPGPARRIGSGKAKNMLKVHEAVGCAVCAKVFISGPRTKLSYYVIE